MKVLFMGTPEFAVASLSALIRSRHKVVGVVTQPDRAVKHGKYETGAVKKFALENGLSVFQPVKIRDAVETLKGYGADIAVTAAYGQLLTSDVLNAFPNGVINVHASLLPKYRGASPIASAILCGERETGVTIMRTELGLDTGDILSVAKTAIGASETAGELTARLSEIGAKLLVDTLDDFDNIVPIPQAGALATHCRTIKKDEQFIDFTRTSTEVVNMIRAYSPLPCAKTDINGEVYKIYAAEETDGTSAKAGEILRSDSALVIACGTGAIKVSKIQAPSKRALDASEFLRGRKFETGVICGKPQ